MLPTEVSCPKCLQPCSFREDQHLWSCKTSTIIPHTKKRRYCSYSVSDYKGTFLDRTHIPPWKLILFVNHFLSHLWDHKTVIDCLQFSTKSSVDWRSFCSEVCEDWFSNQEPIGGPGIEVEIDETLIVKRKYERGRILSQIWLFGGIERISKKRFVVALTGDVGERRDRATLVPLIHKYIREGSVIFSDCWGAYNNLHQQGYTHFTINHSENFVDQNDSNIHTQNIERLWRDIKEWIKRPGIRAKYLHQYLARYLFLTEYKENPLHYFFIQAGKLYPPRGNRQRPAGEEQPEDSDTSSDEE